MAVGCTGRRVDLASADRGWLGASALQGGSAHAPDRESSYANVMATVAVFVALGGSGYAAVTLSKNSVGSKQIKNGAVKNADLAKNAVTSNKVKNGSLLSADFKPGQLVAGAPGATGPQGPKGDPGAAGATGAKDDTGATGRSALTPLQTGETLVGGFDLDTEAPVAGAGDFRTFVPFSIPAPSVPTGAFIAPAGSCSGTHSAPTAPAGKVCVYVVASSNASLFANLDPGTPAILHGFVVGFNNVGSVAGDVYAYGSWAYTAP
jgi:hypothetical protein